MNTKLLLAVALCLLGCTKEDASSEALNKAGFTHISVGGYGWFDCGDYRFKTKFTATNVQGKTVSGVVCCGWIESCAIKY